MTDCLGQSEWPRVEPDALEAIGGLSVAHSAAHIAVLFGSSIASFCNAHWDPYLNLIRYVVILLPR